MSKRLYWYPKAHFPRPRKRDLWKWIELKMMKIDKKQIGRCKKKLEIIWTRKVQDHKGVSMCLSLSLNKKSRIPAFNCRFNSPKFISPSSISPTNSMSRNVLSSRWIVAEKRDDPSINYPSQKKSHPLVKSYDMLFSLNLLFRYFITDVKKSWVTKFQVKNVLINRYDPIGT